MSSQCTSDGSMSITITFELGTDLDTAQVLVQNRVAIAEPRLPEEVRQIGVTTRKSSPDLLMVIHMVSPSRRYDQLYISNYALLQVRDVLARVDGVGDVTMFGARDYSMRVWLDPDRIAELGMTAGDVVAALREQNVQVAAGVIGQPPAPPGTAYQLTVSTLGRLAEAEQFGSIVDQDRRRRPHHARSTTWRASSSARATTRSTATSRASRRWRWRSRSGLARTRSPPRSAIRAAMDELSQCFPEGLEYKIVYNPTQFVAESIDDVIKTLYEAVALVVIVVLVFLQNWRASVIPLVAIPVSLIGTFAAMAALGFSLNSLSLFGLVLAIGIVVDDAIVVVENVERALAEGLAPGEAARQARWTRWAVRSWPRARCSVRCSCRRAFVAGISGQFFRQFAVTIAVSTVISALRLAHALARARAR